MTDSRGVAEPDEAHPANAPLPFRYSAEQWSEIMAQVPAALADDASLVREVRTSLETALGGYLTMTAAHKSRFARGSPANSMLGAFNQIRETLHYAEATGNALVAGHLNAAHQAMLSSTHVEALEMLAHAHRGNNDPARQLLYDIVLRTWTGPLGGSLKVSRPSSGHRKREATGPAVRFLVAAVAPVISIGREGAERIVEAAKSEAPRRNTR
ncbi:hypothetical protein WHZ78_16675 [Bradyrhizobium symbiodeficiens]|uniref:hypothetical protein n=1 Tax=Bradyrhizobium symbiodeficiens TaxID=1404367 RepID=UPI0030CBE7DF